MPYFGAILVILRFDGRIENTLVFSGLELSVIKPQGHNTTFQGLLIGFKIQNVYKS